MLNALVKVSRCLFSMRDEEFLEAFNKIWKRGSNLIKKEPVTVQVYSEKCLKTKLKSHKNEVNSNFDGNELPKEGSHSVIFSVILLYSVFRISKSYYTQVFLEECKYVVKK